MNISEKTARSFEDLAGALMMDPTDLLTSVIEAIVAADMRMRTLGLPGFALFRTAEIEPARPLAYYGLAALPVSVRPTGVLWPENVPFRWTDSECRAAVLGYRVRWPGPAGEFSKNAPGSWEIDADCFASLYRQDKPKRGQGR